MEQRCNLAMVWLTRESSGRRYEELCEERS